MTTKFQSMPVEEFQSFLSRLDLLDSWQAAQFLELSPATLRNPKNKYFKFSVKIGQYRFWRREDLIEMKKWYIARKMDGHLEYFDGVRFSRKKSDATLFDNDDDACNKRTELFGPPPGRTYGTYPTIHSMTV